MHATVGVGALEDVDAVIGAVLADRFLLLPVPVVREHPHGGVVGLRRDLAVSDADVGRDPRLRDKDVVVVLRVEDVRAVAEVVALDEAACRLCVPEAATEQATDAGTGVLVVVHAEVHLVEQRICQPGNAWLGVADDHQRSSEPAVVHAGQEGVDDAAILGPHGDDVSAGFVVPVVEHAAGLVVLQPGHGRQGLGQPLVALPRADDPELPCDDGAPQVATDVGRRGVAAALWRREWPADVVCGQPRLWIGHGDQ